MMSKNKWLERIQSLPVIQRAGLLDYQLIESGSSNHNFKINTESGDWVLRFNQATLGIDRQQEQLILQMIEPTGITPKIIEINPNAGYLITEYIPQNTWRQADFEDPEKINLLKNALAQFHALPYQYLPSRLDHRIKQYLQAIELVPEDLRLTLNQSLNLLEQLKFWQANNTLYHSDLNPNNLMSSDPINIIDWEYAGQGHPLLDWLIMEHHSGIDLSEHYPKGIQAQWIQPAKTMITAMMKLWALQTV